MRHVSTACMAVILGFGMTPFAAVADEKTIPIDKVPKAVADAFKARFPGATVKNAIEETEGGKVTYEIESTVAGGMSLDAVLKPDGEFVAVETQIKVSALPAAVAPAVEARYPKAVIEKAESVDSGGKITYEVAVKKAGGKSAVLVFDKDGRFVEEE